MHTTRQLVSHSRLLQPVPAASMLPVSANRESWHVQLSDAPVLPEQVFGPPASLSTVCPEAALMQAVLEDALTCFQKKFATTGRRVQRVAWEAEEWLLSDDADWPFSFVSICAVLGLEPAAIRERLKRWHHSPPTTPQRTIRHGRGARRSRQLAA